MGRMKDRNIIDGLLDDNICGRVRMDLGSCDK
jgi:hypothetical protein